MKNKTSSKENKNVDNQQDRKSSRQKSLLPKKPAISTVFEELAEEGIGHDRVRDTGGISRF